MNIKFTWVLQFPLSTGCLINAVILEWCSFWWRWEYPKPGRFRRPGWSPSCFSKKRPKLVTVWPTSPKYRRSLFKVAKQQELPLLSLWVSICSFEYTYYRFKTTNFNYIVTIIYIFINTTTIKIFIHLSKCFSYSQHLSNCYSLYYNLLINFIFKVLESS